MTHQEISDRLTQIKSEVAAARLAAFAATEPEREALRLTCGELGHCFSRTRFVISDVRYCAVCELPEPARAG